MTLNRAVLNGRTAWRRAWKQTSRDHRDRVRLAIYNTTPLSDPEDAALAVGFARRQARRWWLAPFSWRGSFFMGLWSWKKGYLDVEMANLPIAARAFEPH